MQLRHKVMSDVCTTRVVHEEAERIERAQRHPKCCWSIQPAPYVRPSVLPSVHSGIHDTECYRTRARTVKPALITTLKNSFTLSSVSSLTWWSWTLMIAVPELLISWWRPHRTCASSWPHHCSVSLRSEISRQPLHLGSYNFLIAFRYHSLSRLRRRRRRRLLHLLLLLPLLPPLRACLCPAPAHFGTSLIFS
jgi:hypothetical protein